MIGLPTYCLPIMKKFPVEHWRNATDQGSSAEAQHSLGKVAEIERGFAVVP
jgi:hypothetical protein